MDLRSRVSTTSMDPSRLHRQDEEVGGLRHSLTTSGLA